MCKYLSLKIISLATAMLFAVTNIGLAQVLSASASHILAKEHCPITTSIQIPEELGSIQDSFQAASESPFVVLIQDAHAVTEAQIHIQKLIEYLGGTYGIDLVALEGTSGKMDATLARAFPDKNVRARIFRDYLNQGEITGAEMAAIFNREQAVFFGIEDMKLYEDNYFAYLSAVKNQNQIIAALDQTKSQLDIRRKAVYSREHNQFYEQVEAFHSEKGSLLQLLKYAKQFPLKRYPILKKICDATDREISRKHLNQISTIKGSALFEELENFISGTENNFCRNQEERGLAEAYHHNRLLRDLASLELTRDQWGELKNVPHEFVNAVKFYEIALKRDAALYQNLNRLIAKQKAKSAMIIAGGFHTNGLKELLKKSGYSYMVIIPTAGSIQGHQNYAGLMQGNLSYKQYLKGSWYEAFLKDASIRLSRALDPRDSAAKLKYWRDEVIRTTAREGRVGESEKYTRYIDFPQSKSRDEILAAVKKVFDTFLAESLHKTGVPAVNSASASALIQPVAHPLMPEAKSELLVSAVANARSLGTSIERSRKMFKAEKALARQNILWEVLQQYKSSKEALDADSRAALEKILKETKLDDPEKPTELAHNLDCLIDFMKRQAEKNKSIVDVNPVPAPIPPAPVVAPPVPTPPTPQVSCQPLARLSADELEQKIKAFQGVFERFREERAYLHRQAGQLKPGEKRLYPDELNRREEENEKLIPAVRDQIFALTGLLPSEPHRENALQLAAQEMRKNPGALVSISKPKRFIPVGDLQGEVGNLLNILLIKDLLKDLASGDAQLIFDGDVVHPSIGVSIEEDYLGRNSNSIASLALISYLKVLFPNSVHYLAGNHEYSHLSGMTVLKDEIDQTLEFEKALKALGGEKIKNDFFELVRALPIAARIDLGDGHAALVMHAGPSQKLLDDAQGDLPSKLRDVLLPGILHPGNPAKIKPGENPYLYSGADGILWRREYSTQLINDFLNAMNADVLIVGHNQPGHIRLKFEGQNLIKTKGDNFSKGGYGVASVGNHKMYVVNAETDYAWITEFNFGQKKFIEHVIGVWEKDAGKSFENDIKEALGTVPPIVPVKTPLSSTAVEPVIAPTPAPTKPAEVKSVPLPFPAPTQPPIVPIKLSPSPAPAKPVLGPDALNSLIIAEKQNFIIRVGNEKNAPLFLVNPFGAVPVSRNAAGKLVVRGKFVSFRQVIKKIEVGTSNTGGMYLGSGTYYQPYLYVHGSEKEEVHFELVSESGRVTLHSGSVVDKKRIPTTVGVYMESSRITAEENLNVVQALINQNQIETAIRMFQGFPIEAYENFRKKLDETLSLFIQYVIDHELNGLSTKLREEILMINLRVVKHLVDRVKTLEAESGSGMTFDPARARLSVEISIDDVGKGALSGANEKTRAILLFKQAEVLYPYLQKPENRVFKKELDTQLIDWVAESIVRKLNRANSALGALNRALAEKEIDNAVSLYYQFEIHPENGLYRFHNNRNAAFLMAEFATLLPGLGEGWQEQNIVEIILKNCKIFLEDRKPEEAAPLIRQIRPFIDPDLPFAKEVSRKFPDMLRLNYGWHDTVVDSGVIDRLSTERIVPAPPKETVLGRLLAKIRKESPDSVKGEFKELLWTHNTSLEKFKLIIQSGYLSSDSYRGAQFRYGLDSEYGAIKFIMKRGFEARPEFKGKGKAEGKKSKKTFYDLFKKAHRFYGRDMTDQELRDHIARDYDFRGHLSPLPDSMDDQRPYFERSYVNPQLQLGADVDLIENVEAVLIPEHLYAGVEKFLLSAKCRSASEMLKRIRKVSGTGKDDDEYFIYQHVNGEVKGDRYEAIEVGVGRPVWIQGNSSDYTTGPRAFALEEKEYLEITARAIYSADEEPLVQPGAQFPAVDGIDDSEFDEITEQIFQHHQLDTYNARIWKFFTKGRQHNHRDSRKLWKLFINPRPEDFLEVLDRVAKVLEREPDVLGKIVGSNECVRKSDEEVPMVRDPNEPKFLLYFYGDHAKSDLKRVVESIEREFSAAEIEQFGADRGKRDGYDQWGPSFTKKRNKLLFYSQGGFGEAGRDEYLVGKDRAANGRRLAKVFDGENFYKFKGETDPFAYGASLGDGADSQYSVGVRMTGASLGGLDVKVREAQRAFLTGRSPEALLRYFTAARRFGNGTIIAPPEDLTEEELTEIAREFFAPKGVWPRGGELQGLDPEDPESRLNAIRWLKQLNRHIAGWYGPDLVRGREFEGLREVLEFSPDSRYARVDFVDGGFGVIELSTGRRITIEGVQDVLRFSPDSRYVIVSFMDNSRGVIELATGRRVIERVLNICEFSPDVQYARCSFGNGSWGVIELLTGRRLIEGMSHVRGFSPDSQYASVEFPDRTSGVIKLSTGRRIAFEGVRAVLGFSPDSKYVHVSFWGESYGIIDISTRRTVIDAAGDLLEFSPDSRYVSFSIEDRVFGMIELSTRRRMIFENVLRIWGFSPDSRYVHVRFENGMFGVIEVVTGRRVIEGMGAVLGFSPDSRYVCVIFHDGTPGVIELVTGHRVTIEGVQDVLAWSPDMSQWLVRNDEGRVQLLHAVLGVAHTGRGYEQFLQPVPAITTMAGRPAEGERVTLQFSALPQPQAQDLPANGPVEGASLGKKLDEVYADIEKAEDIASYIASDAFEKNVNNRLGSMANIIDIRDLLRRIRDCFVASAPRNDSGNLISPIQLSASAKFLLANPEVLAEALKRKHGIDLNLKSDYVIDASFLHQAGAEKFICELGSSVAVTFASGTPDADLASRLHGTRRVGYGHNNPLDQKKLRTISNPVLILPSGIVFKFQKDSDWKKRGVEAEPALVNPYETSEFVRLVEIALQTRPLKNNGTSFPVITPEILNSVVALLNNLAKEEFAQEALQQAA